jgi:hypothetical protein
LTEAHVEADWTIDRFDDIAHRGFTAAGENGESTSLSPPGSDEVRAREGLENLGEEALRSFSDPGEIREECSLVFGQRGEMDHDAHGVIGGTGELHGGVALIRRGELSVVFHASSVAVLRIWTDVVQIRN